MLCFLRYVALQAVFWLTLSGVCLAKDNPTQGPPGYAEAVTQALAELDANNFPEAREEFRRAHALYPNARTLRGLGMVEFELRNYAESVRYLEQALASGVKPLEGSMRESTQTLLERARRYLGEIVLQFDPPTTAVRLDGARVDARSGKVFLLEVGEHTFELSAAGRATERRVVQVNGGERSELRVKLAKLEPASAPEGSPAPLDSDSTATQSERTPLYKKWWLWTTVALVAAGGATAAVILIQKNKEPELQAQTGTNTVGVSLQTLRSF